MNNLNLPELTLEKFLLGELETEQTSKVNQILEEEKNLPESQRALTLRLESLKTKNENFSFHYPFHQLESKLKPQRRPSAKPWAMVGVAFASLFLCLSMWLIPQSETGRLKGLTPSLSIYLKVGTEVRKLNSGERIPKGGEIQISYNSASKKYGAVISMDSLGNQTWHSPEKPGKLMKLKQGETALPTAFVLDESPNFEKFFLVASDEESELQAYLKGLKVKNEKTGETYWEHGVPPGVEVNEFLLRK